MSSKRNLSPLTLGLVGALAFVTIAAIALKRRHAAPTDPGRALASLSATGSASPARSAPTSGVESALPLPPVPPPKAPFVFDCGFVSSSRAERCAAAEPRARALLDQTRTFRGGPCDGWLEPRVDKIRASLGEVAKLDAKNLAPLERAILQNTALELLSCSSKLSEKSGSALAALARPLLEKFALTDDERAALPGSDPLLGRWLGAPDAWKRGTVSTFFHAAAEGDARVHLPLRQKDSFADVVRLIVLGSDGAPHVTDTVERVVIRRGDRDATRVCIAEIDPFATGATARARSSTWTRAPARPRSSLRETRPAGAATSETGQIPGHSRATGTSPWTRRRALTAVALLKPLLN